jgi:hypothetical protein
LVRWLPIMTSWRKDKQSWMLRRHAHIPDNEYWGICLFHVVWTNFFLQLFLCGTHGIYYYFFSSTEHYAWAIISPKEFKSWVTRISFALLYGKTELSAVRLNCDLLLKSAFDRNFNVMQLILVKIKWHIKWKYLIKKFHVICLSYYFKSV